MITMEALRLNLGGMGEGNNDTHIEGFKTVDLRDGADIQSDVSNLTMIKSLSVSEIYASNILEHFPHTKTLTVLKEWHRVLIPGSSCWISVPDFEANVKLFLKEGLVPWVQFLLWGDQLHPLNFHYINFTFATLAEVLTDAGFEDVQRVIQFPFPIRDASTMRDGKYGIRISLNVKATA